VPETHNREFPSEAAVASANASGTDKSLLWKILRISHLFPRFYAPPSDVPLLNSRKQGFYKFDEKKMEGVDHFFSPSDLARTSSTEANGRLPSFDAPFRP
jgi:hypothetical protein